MAQTTLSERAVSEEAIALHSDADIANILPRIYRTDRPAPANVTYSPAEWESIINDCTASLALAARNRVQSSALRRILSAIAMKKSGERSLISETVNLTVADGVSEKLHEKTRFLLYHGFKRLPPVAGPLLAGWIPEVKILDDASYRNIVPHETSTGYYHPEEHWIAIRRDPAWGDTDAWPISKPGVQDEYDHSTILHELGHALHYMLGVQTLGCDTVDNRHNAPGSWECSLRKDLTRSTWQWETVIRPVQAAYLNLERGQTSALDLKEYQVSTLEEFIAEGFTVWATSPKYLKQEQPRLWAIFAGLR